MQEAAVADSGHDLPDHLRRLPLMPGRAVIQDDAAADGLHGGVEPDNEAVPPLHRHRLRKAQLGKVGLARLQRILLQQHHLGDVGPRWSATPSCGPLRAAMAAN